MNLRDELQTIYDQHGKLTPTLVVATARDEAHPLHARFTWDDSVAGERWRREEARLMIRSLKVVYKPADGRKPERATRAFHAIPIPDDSGEQDFYSAEDVAADPVMTAVLLAEMEREWRAFKARWSHFSEFAAMIAQEHDIAA